MVVRHCEVFGHCERSEAIPRHCERHTVIASVTKQSRSVLPTTRTRLPLTAAKLRRSLRIRVPMFGKPAMGCGHHSSRGLEWEVSFSPTDMADRTRGIQASMVGTTAMGRGHCERSEAIPRHCERSEAIPRHCERPTVIASVTKQSRSVLPTTRTRLPLTAAKLRRSLCIRVPMFGKPVRGVVITRAAALNGRCPSARQTWQIGRVANVAALLR